MRTQEETKSVIDKLDTYFAAHPPAGIDSTRRKAAFSSHLLSIDALGAFVPSEELPAVRALFATPEIDSIVPGDTQLLWGAAEHAARPAWPGAASTC